MFVAHLLTFEENVIGFDLIANKCRYSEADKQWYEFY